MMEFIDLGAQQARIKEKIDERIQAVLTHGKYIMGPEVAELERGLSAFCGSPLQALTCSNGTDAISMVLMALGVGPGDAVFVPSFTFAATAEVVSLQRATPVFTDVSAHNFNMDPSSLERAIEVAKEQGLNPKVVITVDLFGQPADYDAIEPIVKQHGLKLICDAAQGFGGVYKGRKVGTIGDATTTSFFPAKPLGCYGDGGAVFTADRELDDIMKSIRVHGKGKDKYDNARVGLNARLDTIQAGILIEKLEIFSDEILSRNRVADRYNAAFHGHDQIYVPTVTQGCTSTWAQYTLRLPEEKRDNLALSLGKMGVPTVVYYPMPLHLQNAYKMHPRGDEVTVSERLSKEVLSLPMHPYLDGEMQQHVIDSVLRALET